MSGMTNVENRNRVRAGKTAGRFAPEAHQEPAGVTLTAPAPLDEAAVGLVADLVRTRSSVEMGSWQRQMDKGGGHLRPMPPTPEVLVELDRRAKGFETLPRTEQVEVLDQLKLTGAAFLLEPGQKLGNDRVQVADDLNAPDDLGVALAAQKVMTESGIEGPITLVEAGKYPKFTVEDGPLVHKVSLGERALSFSSEAADDEWDSERSEWLRQAEFVSSGGSVFDAGLPDYVGRIYKEQRGYAVMMDVVSASSFRGSRDLLGELNRRDRTAELTVDGTEYQLNVSGAEPALKTGDGTTLHASMVPGFLNHVATTTGHPDGATLASDLREVFRETDRRLIP
jgi:hypothetical protein